MIAFHGLTSNQAVFQALKCDLGIYKDPELCVFIWLKLELNFLDLSIDAIQGLLDVMFFHSSFRYAFDDFK